MTPFVLDEEAASHGMAEKRDGAAQESGAARLSRLITETRSDFDAETSSVTRLKASAPVKPVSLPRDWAKKVG